MARNLPAITDDDIPEATSSFHDMILRASARINDREKLAEYTKAHGTDRPFLTIEDERDLTRAAVARFDVDFDSARWLTSGILMENGVALERDLDKKNRALGPPVRKNRKADHTPRIQRRGGNLPLVGSECRQRIRSAEKTEINH